MLSSILSILLRKPYKVSTDDGLEDDKFPLFSYPTLLCKLTSKRQLQLSRTINEHTRLFCRITEFLS